METKTPSKISEYWSRLTRWLRSLWDGSIDWLGGCLASPLVVTGKALWWAIGLVVGLGCIFVGVPLLLLVYALVAGFGWWTIPVAIVAFILAMLIGPEVWILWILIKRFWKWLWKTDESAARERAEAKAKARTWWIVMGALLFTGLCLPLAVPVLLVVGVIVLIRYIGSLIRTRRNVQHA